MEQSEREVLEKQADDLRTAARDERTYAQQARDAILSLSRRIDAHELNARAKDAAADRIEVMLRGAP